MDRRSGIGWRPGRGRARRALQGAAEHRRRGRSSAALARDQLFEDSLERVSARAGGLRLLGHPSISRTEFTEPTLSGIRRGFSGSGIHRPSTTSLYS